MPKYCKKTVVFPKTMALHLKTVFNVHKVKSKLLDLCFCLKPPSALIELNYAFYIEHKFYMKLSQNPFKEEKKPP